MFDADYARLAALADVIETEINALQEPAQLLPAYQTGLKNSDPLTRRAWQEVAPAAAQRRFGDCKEVNTLQLERTVNNDK